MLEFAKILRDIDDLGRERAATVAGLEEELAVADEVMANICSDLESATARIRSARTSWLVATSYEPPDRTYPAPPVPTEHAVVATDGSQIVPNKHEITLCYLLNTSCIMLYYGTGERPIALSNPKLYYRDDDLFEEPYAGGRVRLNERILSMRRTLAEAGEMESGIRSIRASGLPAVALWDGSLIRWEIANEPVDYRDRVLEEYLHVFDVAMELGVPIIGYISDPGSKDFVNSMRVMLCDQEPVDCDKCPHKERNEAPPCDRVARLKDSVVFGRKLSAGQRSVVFTCSSSILNLYREHRVTAFYANTGKETVRIELPEWVAADRSLLDLVHAVCCDQAAKGRGYPVSLAEAHEHAVVHGQERDLFYQMVERSFVKHGAPVGYSLKRHSKGY